jgi:hypothetical protein
MMAVSAVLKVVVMTGATVMEVPEIAGMAVADN